MWEYALPGDGVPTELGPAPESPWVVLGLGSNVEAERSLPWALTRLCQSFAPLYIAQPCQSIDHTGGARAYVNWVVAFPSDWEDQRLHAFAKTLEAQWGARVDGRVPLDVDLLYHAATDTWHRQAGCSYWRSGILQLFPHWRTRLPPGDALPIQPWLPEPSRADRG